MLFRLFSLLAVFLLLAGASAANTWSDCSDNTSGDLVRITKLNLVCMDCTDSAGADACVDSRLFFIGAKSALVCFDPDAAGSEGADAAQIDIRYCPDGQKPAANPEYVCGKITNSVITGIQGAAGTQDACHRLPPGAYYIDFSNDGGAGDEPRVTIQGEGAR